MTAGIVVAGGYSTRFGLAEKGLVEVGDEPMLAHVVRAIGAVSDAVVVDCRAEQLPAFEAAIDASDVPIRPRFVVDDAPDEGPIAGLATALDAFDSARHREAVVASCDRPGVTPAVYEVLTTRRRLATADAAIPERDGLAQPLCGVYRTERLTAAVEAARRAGDRRLLGVPRALDVETVPERALAARCPQARIESVDTPLEAHRLRCSRRNAAVGAGRGSREQPAPIHAGDLAASQGPRRLLVSSTIFSYEKSGAPQT